MKLKIFTSSRGGDIEREFNDWLVAVPTIKIERTELRVANHAEAPLIVLAIWYDQ